MIISAKPVEALYSLRPNKENMSRNRIILVTVGIMLSLFLASMESTVVATAMPTIVGQLGGLENYSWVFSAFMLTSTTTVPLYGKLSDIYGRRKLYVFAMALFLIGSVLCGMATTLTHLILARALQGIGAGGIMPLAFILIGEMFSLEQRTKMQGVFSGVWGVSSVAGPLLGGFIVDRLSWHWIFYINVFPGLIAGVLVAFAWRDQAYSHERPAVDYAGAALLSASVVLLLLGLMELGASQGWVFIASAVGLFVILFHVERRAADPILPLALFRDRLFATATSHGLFTGWAVFGTISFIPLFVQSVLGASPTQAGVTVTPMLLGWVACSIFGSRILLKVGYRRLSIIGTSLFFIRRGRESHFRDGLRHPDGHGHGAFDPRVCDRRADHSRTASSWDRHLDASIQPFDGRDVGSERDGRRIERATRRQPQRLRSRREPDLPTPRPSLRVRRNRRNRRAPRHVKCHPPRFRHRLRRRRAGVDRRHLHPAQRVEGQHPNGCACHSRLRIRKNINSLLEMQFDLLGKSCVTPAVQLRTNKHTGSY